MIISTKKGTPQVELDRIVDNFEKQGLSVTLIRGTDYNVFGLVGDTTKIAEKDVLANPWVENVTRVSAPYKRANRLFHPEDTVVDINGVRVGGNAPIAVMAGPCSIEGEEQALRIMEGLRDRYEAHHHVRYSDEALQAAVSMSSRYIQDRFLPDKAIDVLDEAGARMRIRNRTLPDEIRKFDDELRRVRLDKEEAASAQEFERAAQLRDEEKQLEEQRAEAEKRFSEESDKELANITEVEIADVVSMSTGVPVSNLTEAEADKLIRDAHLLEEAGCFAIVLEKIPATLAERVASELTIPIIGIGAGGHVDGQVLVIQDMLGMNNGFRPRFLRRYADLYTVMTDAISRYVSDVKNCYFPNEKEQY